MFNIDNATRKPAAGVLAVLTLACLGLTACGGSSGSSTNAAATGAATASTATTPTTGAAGGSTSTGGSSSQGNRPGGVNPRFAAMRECLQKNGITLPKRTPGSGGSAGGGFPGANGPQLPAGVTRAQYEAALKKCGGNGRFRPGAGFRRPNNPAFKQALTKFGECLRQNGINIPPPNTSGKGPIFSTKGIDTKSSQFKAATMKCRGALLGSLKRPNGAPSTAGSPPAGGQIQGGASSESPGQ